MVPEARLELARLERRGILNPLCLPIPPLGQIGAGNEARTRDPDLGKVVLYQLSYSRLGVVTFKFWSGKRGSNSRPRPWQGRALPTELFPHTLLVRCILREFEILSIEDLKKKFKC